MEISNFLNAKPLDENKSKNIVDYVYAFVQTQKGIRVEDAICLICTIVAERCIEAASEYSINDHNFEPGSALFSDKINELLVGPVSVNNWNRLPKECVFAQIKTKIDSQFEIDFFPSLTEIFENYAKNVGKTEWGNLNLTVPDNNKPFLLPLQAGYESRKFINKNFHTESTKELLEITLNAMAMILIETKMALNPSITLFLTFEIINGMSKTASMTDKKMQELNSPIEK